MDRISLAREIYRVSHLTGQFTLRSGKISNEYFDKYLFESDPALLAAVAEHLARLVPEKTEILAGLEMGGIAIATALSLKTGIPCVFVRKQAKTYGTCKLAEGTDIAGKTVCIVEDVVTTAGQILSSSEELKQRGAHLNGVLCVIEREPTGRSNLARANLTLHSLFTMDDLLMHG